MNNFFMLVGASGVGKSVITTYIKTNKDVKSCNCLKKHTTRALRKEEIRKDFEKELDLYFEKEMPSYVNDKDHLIYLRGGALLDKF